MRRFQHALRLVDGSSEAEHVELRARILISLAYNDAEVRSFAAGLGHLRSANELLADIPDRVLRLDLHSIIRSQHGAMLARAGRFAESIDALDEAVALGEKARAQGVPNADSLGRNLMNRAVAYIAEGRPKLAERDLNQCVAITRAGAAGGRSDAESLAVLAAKAHHNLGSLAWRTGDVPLALRYQEEANRSYQELSPSLLPKLRLDQAEILLTAGLAEEAARHLDEALPEMQRQRDHQNIAEAETLRAVAAVIDGDYGTARRLASSARRRFLRRGSGAWATIARLTALRAEVASALERGRVPPTLPGRALELVAELAECKLVDESAVARLLAVRLELCRGAVEVAEAQLALVPKPRRFVPVEHRMLRLLCRAELAAARGDRRQAFRHAAAGFAELNRWRDRMGGLELVSGFAAHGRELGELAVRLVLAGPRSAARRLFDWLERTRAQVYRYEPLPPLDNPVLTERIQEYRHLSTQLQRAKLSGQPVGSLVSRHAALQREVMRLGWRDSPWGRPRPAATLNDVIESLGDRALVSYVASGPDLAAIVVADGRARLVRLGRVADAITAASELHADLDALSPDTLPEPLALAVTESARRRSERLGGQLVRSWQHILGDRELVVVPTGPLYAVAWSVLPELRGRPVVVAPSATAWLAAVRGATQRQGDDEKRTVLVGGPGLPAAVGEVGRLRAYHPDARLLAAERATVQTVLNALDGGSLAHVAAHGTHEPENALFSRLDLVDGPLFAHETTRLRRPPEHVVLAACELALSRIRAGDEALGFAGALLSAGVPTVTAAVSRVGDEAAADAMADYHRLLASGVPPARALAEANGADPLRRPFVCLGASE